MLTCELCFEEIDAKSRLVVVSLSEGLENCVLFAVECDA